MVNTTRSKFWGPHFPDVWDVGVRHWGPHFPDPVPALDLVTPTGPAGVATFVADLEAGFTMTLERQTDVQKAHDGTEERAAVIDDPRRRISCTALLIGGASVRSLRSKLRQHAASGAVFLLGLPFEGLAIAADAIGTTVTVNAGALASCDWANPGQRVVILAGNRTALNAVVQSASGTSIVLDVAPGAIGKEGGVIMPTIPIFLDPQQGFARYMPPDGIERWQLKATAASFGWQKQAVAAQLAGLNTGTSGVLDDLFFQARTPGAAGNAIRVALDDESLAGIDFVEVGNDITISFVPGVSTVGDLAAAINANSSLIRIIGSWDPDALLTSVADEFEFLNLAGGADGDYATEGAGVLLTVWADRYVFDRPLVMNSDTNDDSMQAMNEIVELGGVPANVGAATMPDWGRRIAMLAKPGLPWQWLKRFLATVRGRQRAFWLPTWRRDLVAVGTGVNTLTIQSGEAFSSWDREDIQIRQVDGTISYATISSFVDNGDGTTTLSIGTTLSGSPVDMISWLELCRLEDDAIDVVFDGVSFAMTTTARVVTQ